jgi:hypothetical protein
MNNCFTLENETRSEGASLEAADVDRVGAARPRLLE